MSVSNNRSFLKALGPGLLFAGAAVGVSHLVQSTRAGARYGLALLGVVLVANVVKYPAFSFGPRYAAATGTSLLEAYRRQGRWALWLYGALTVGTMFTVQAAVTIVTAGLAKVTLGLPWNPLWIAVGLTVICVGILVVGRFRWLDRINKVVVCALTLCTLAATALALPRVDWSTAALVPSGIPPRDLLFLAALIGWMPSAIDVSIWHSLWTVARRRDTGHRPTVRESMLDFDIGYLGTALLAFCFVFLGAAVVHGSSAEIPNSAGAFAALVLKLYTQTLGAWSGPLISTCALLVMFSTTLTVVDGFPRALCTLAARFRGPEKETDSVASDRIWWIVLAVGSLLILFSFVKQLRALIDLATTLSFLTAPLLSILNHRAILSDAVPDAARPGRRMIAASLAGIAIQAAFALWYLQARFLA